MTEHQFEPTTEAQSAASDDATAKPLLDCPKRQHFLSCFYLEGFTKDGLLAEFDRKMNEMQVQQPVNTGVIGYFISIPLTYRCRNVIARP